MVTVQFGRIKLGVEQRRWRLLEDGGWPHLAVALRDRLNVEAGSALTEDPLLFDPERPRPDLALARQAIAGRPDARIVDASKTERGDTKDL